MNEWIGSNARGIAIVRVSSQRQRDNISHDAQEAEIRRYCEKNKIHLVEVYRIIESAKDSENRKQYNQAINRALHDEIRHVLFYMHDREARNLTDSERNEKLVLADLIVLHYVNENKVLHRGSPSSEFLMRDMMASVNKQYSRALSVKVLDAMRQKAEAGWFPGNHLPLGYVHERLKDENGKALKSGTRIIPDPDGIKVRQVQREFELRSLGFSFRAIRDQVLKEGFLPESRARQYSHAVIEHRIKHPFYGGKFIWQGIEYQGQHELIIPKSTLERVKRSFTGRSFALRATSEHGLFGQGWLRCAICDCAVVYDPKKRAYRSGKSQVFHYYHCTNGKRMHPTMGGMNMPEHEIWDQLERAVDSITLGESLAQQIARALSETEARARAQLQFRITGWKDQIRAIEAKEERMYGDLQSGIIDEMMFIRVTRKLRDERKEYLTQLEGAYASLRGTALETARSTLELASSAKHLYKSRSPQERKELLDLLVSNPRLRGRSIEFDLRKPFSTLSQMRESEDWLALLDDFRTSCMDSSLL